MFDSISLCSSIRGEVVFPHPLGKPLLSTSVSNRGRPGWQPPWGYVKTYLMGPTFHFEDNCEKVVKLKLGSIFGTGSSPELGKPGLPEGEDAITAEARFDHTQRLVSPPSPLHWTLHSTHVSIALHCTRYLHWAALHWDIIAHKYLGLQSPLHTHCIKKSALGYY